MISRIKFFNIPVRDQNRALHFYTEKLGFTVLTDAPAMSEGASPRWIELGIPGAETGVTLFTPEGQEDRIGTFMSISYETGNLQKSYEELRARGVEFTCPPSEQPWGSYAMFKDSEGNIFCLATPGKSS